jgi:hypothetical protein
MVFKYLDEYCLNPSYTVLADDARDLTPRLMKPSREREAVVQEQGFNV